MAVSPDYTGSYGRPWLITLNTDSGPDQILGISKTSISIILRNTTGIPADNTSTGDIEIVTASPAVISWQPTAADFANAGNYSVYPVVTFPTGPVVYDPIPLQINAR